MNNDLNHNNNNSSKNPNQQVMNTNTNDILLPNYHHQVVFDQKKLSM